jgi:hypothetical protein
MFCVYSSYRHSNKAQKNTPWKTLHARSRPSPLPPFVIPSEAEGSAVPLTPLKKCFSTELSWAFGPPKGMKNCLYSFFCPFLTELSSRPKRTRISCHAALDKAACAPFCKGKAHEVHQRHQVPQEIRGSVVEGSAVQRTPLGNVFRPSEA